ncbi:hypothetical protein A3F62_04860 [Candidatus Woesebacteria bacterium RIFCSPHIGHO2_12_FULL_44_11]|nr:MAG: hypothetical protein A3F62_04860 [Candidatus Woesebacteria bacterium RIFCSPHIGHO2_12_FULL_44_11]
MNYLSLVQDLITETGSPRTFLTIRFITGLEGYQPYEINEKDEIRPLISNYLKLTFWFSVNQDHAVVSEKEFTAVLNEIGRVEEALLANGVSETNIKSLIKYTTDMANKKLNELTESQQLKMLQAIFGTKKSD